VNNELETIWKEVAATLFLKYYPGIRMGELEIHELVSRIN
jgi:hypothetical protein